MIDHSSCTIRQAAALLCICTLAWDYFRDPNEVFGSFAIWALVIHFMYFQLPIRSHALAYFHPTSLIGSCLIPVMYSYLLLHKPSLEIFHMQQWDTDQLTVFTRAFLIHLAPLLFHVLDIASNQVNLIQSYQNKPKKFIYIWSVVSFPLVGLVFELLYPETEETNKLLGVSREVFLMRNKVISLFVLMLTFLVLYLLILRRAYIKRTTSSKEM